MNGRLFQCPKVAVTVPLQSALQALNNITVVVFVCRHAKHCLPIHRNVM